MIRPRLLREPALALAAGAASQIFDMGAIDLFYVETDQNLEAIFFPPSIGTNTYDGSLSESFPLIAGETISLDQGELGNWGSVQLRNTSASPATVDLILNCRGRA